MSINRVQKLLFSEYSDFEDMVLIESPFAQTTKQGRGIRQVYLGLTPTKLVLATDVIPPVEQSCAYCNPRLDPDIETFELIAIYPVECVNLSVFSKQKRQALKAHFCNNIVLYFELGGFERRKMFWNLWLERIRFLTPDDSNSSKSETSVASDSTTSTLYLVESKQVVKKNGGKQLWCKFGTGNSQSALLQKWTDRYLYLGKSFEDLPTHYLPHVHKPTLKEFVQKASLTRNKTSPSASEASQNALSPNTSMVVNRFGNGINDNCSTTLLMAATVDGKTSARLSVQELDILIEECVRCWEMNSVSPKIAHKRRYGLSPYPYFLHGLGPWNIPPGCRFSVQVKRAVSNITIQRQPIETELILPVSRRQLLATISYDDLKTNRLTDRSASNRMPVILFWTPYYWYRPRTAKQAYDELRNHLSSIKDCQERKQHRKKIRKLCWKKMLREDSETASDIDMDSLNTRITSKAIRSRKPPLRQKKNVELCKEKRETPLQTLKRSLQMDLILTAWDFDSTTLAQQLTVIDKELLLRVTSVELGIIIWQQSAKNAPNISAIIAFAHRISCLVANEILREDSEQIRARLIARFINVAYKCHHISNYQSCRTILAGLQSLAIFRLKLTWTYVRKKHATTYKTFEYLCKLYRDIRLPAYQKSFSIAIQDPPYLPQVADILGRLLDRIPNYELQKFRKVTTKTYLDGQEERTPLLQTSLESNNFSVGSLIQSIKYLLMPTRNKETQKKDQCCKNKDGMKRSIRKVPFTFRALHNYFKPIELHEDNKIECLQQTTKFLQCCQLAAVNYCFTKNELATNYLLKARYREDKENFFISLSIEPPIYCDKYSNKKI
ncbi:hypothetical protein WA026_009917 [Henosepilachna vigintioctopunctata]|uniref:Ras-GEF domain-containing protein n=1 Tax=Henosepilachna vigintioctopunctata TaxID=420089 RepID=A0AAW1TL74_9CUCU